jgi:hypothetical protein
MLCCGSRKSSVSAPPWRDFEQALRDNILDAKILGDTFERKSITEIIV